VQEYRECGVPLFVKSIECGFIKIIGAIWNCYNLFRTIELLFMFFWEMIVFDKKDNILIFGYV